MKFEQRAHFLVRECRQTEDVAASILNLEFINSISKIMPVQLAERIRAKAVYLLSVSYF